MTAELTAAITSLRAAADIAKAMIGLRDAALIQSKVIELQGEILSAQSSAFAAQETQSALLERVRNLEKEVADLEAWETEREKYELKEIIAGVFAFGLKENAGTSEPQHFLCSNCYQDRRKSILQAQKGRDLEPQLHCPKCQMTIVVGNPPPIAPISVVRA